VTGDEDEPASDAPEERFVFPGFGDQPTLPQQDEEQDEQEEPDEPMVVVRARIPVGEGAALCQRLEGEGIECDYARAEDNDDSDDDAVVMVNVLVRRSDLTTAGEVLGRPADPEDDDDDDEDDAEHERRLAADWICPTCKKRTLEILPLTPFWRSVRTIGILSALTPVLIGLVRWAIPSDAVLKQLDPNDPWVIWAFIIGLTMFALSFALPNRDKGCPKCGWSTAV